jgi:hypothetical protein
MREIRNRQEFFEALKAAAPEYSPRCFSCHRGGEGDEENWDVHPPKSADITSKDQEQGPRIEGVGLLPLPLIVAVCKHCGFVRMHTLNELSQAGD